MPYVINFLDNEGIILIKNSGILRYEDYANQAMEAFELGQNKQSELYLADCTRMENIANVFEIFDLPDFYARINIPRSIKIAVLLSDNAVTNEDLKFYETISTNRGWQVKLFSDQDSAIVWLRG